MKKENLSEILHQVGSKIAELRIAKPLTQAALAERLGMTVGNYQRIEHGTQNPTLRTLIRIAGVLEVAPLELLRAPEKQGRRRGRPPKH